jgi:hypothetical protein
MIRVRPSSQAPVPIALAIKEAFNVFIDRHHDEHDLSAKRWYAN